MSAAEQLEADYMEDKKARSLFSGGQISIVLETTDS
jgi:hypothetical protein